MKKRRSAIAPNFEIFKCNFTPIFENSRLVFTPNFRRIFSGHCKIVSFLTRALERACVGESIGTWRAVRESVLFWVSAVVITDVRPVRSYRKNFSSDSGLSRDFDRRLLGLILPWKVRKGKYLTSKNQTDLGRI